MKLRTLLLFIFIFTSISFAENSQDQEYIINKITKINIDGSINPATLSYIEGTIKHVQSTSSDALLLQLNTPGGLVSTTKSILGNFGKSNVPIIVWIGPEGSSATSAGALIASGAHLIFMARGSNIGAATPIQLSGDLPGKPEKGKEGEESPSSDLRKKAINDLVALVSSLAEARGRDSKPFKEMVETAASFTSQKAMELNIINGIASDQNELLNQLHGQTFILKGQKQTISSKNPFVEVFAMDMGQKLLDILANPSLAYILFLLGAALLYFELQAPGGLIAGSLGVVCLLLAGVGFQVLPLHFGALGLIVLAFLLFILEIYITSFGLLSLAGLASLIVGSLFLFRGDDSYMKISTSLVVTASCSVGFIIAFVGYFLFKDIKMFQKFKYDDFQGQNSRIIKNLGKNNLGEFQYHISVKGEVWKAKSLEELNPNEQAIVTGKANETKTLLITKRGSI